jgi:hypothetical protein
MMTSMPVIESSTAPAAIGYFPQLVDGENFTTEYLLMNTATANARLQFFGSNNEPLSLMLR